MPTHHHTPEHLSLPRISDDAVVQIHDFIHQILDLFESRYGDQIRRFYEDLGGEGDFGPNGSPNLDDPPF